MNYITDLKDVAKRPFSALYSKWKKRLNVELENGSVLL